MCRTQPDGAFSCALVDGPTVQPASARKLSAIVGAARVGDDRRLHRVADERAGKAASDICSGSDPRRAGAERGDGARRSRRDRGRAGAGGGLVSAPQCEDPLAVLTAREREVLALMAEGLTDRGIREALWVRQKTVESHVRSIFRKLWSCYVATYCARSDRASLRDTTPNCPVPSEPIPNRCLLGPPPVRGHGVVRRLGPLMLTCNRSCDGCEPRSGETRPAGHESSVLEVGGESIPSGEWRRRRL